MNVMKFYLPLHAGTRKQSKLLVLVHNSSFNFHCNITRRKIMIFKIILYQFVIIKSVNIIGDQPCWSRWNLGGAC